MFSMLNFTLYMDPCIIQRSYHKCIKHFCQKRTKAHFPSKHELSIMILLFDLQHSTKTCDNTPPTLQYLLPTQKLPICNTCAICIFGSILQQQAKLSPTYF